MAFVSSSLVELFCSSVYILYTEGYSGMSLFFKIIFPYRKKCYLHKIIHDLLDQENSLATKTSLAENEEDN